MTAAAAARSPLLVPYLELRAELAAGPAPQVDVGRALTGAMDACLRDLSAGLGGLEPAVVAVGGYGRAELCLQSDIDVMLLHDGDLSEAAVRAVLYPLWDAKLKVGHAVRSVPEAVAAARVQPETLTALLDARLVAGPAPLLDELWAGLRALLRRGRVDLGAVLRAAQAARLEAEPYPRLEVDVKEGRGGLRALHGFGWEAKAAALRAGGPPPSDEGLDPELRGAESILLATRNALHAASGRAHNRFSHGLRPAVAAWRSTTVAAAAADVYRAVRTVDRRAAARWGPVRSRPRRRRAPEPASPLQAALAAAPAAAPGTAGAAGRWLPGDVRALVDLVGTGPPGFVAFDRLVASEWGVAALPEWGHVVAAPQHVPFHAHPVDAHLWRTAAEVLAIAGPDGGEPWCPEVADELTDLDDVVLAALLHDIGKGQDGDHAVVGAQLAATACRRMGRTADSVANVTHAVRHHLLLPEVATRRDVDDPVVVGQVADAVRDLAGLRRLFLLSVADARATGPSMWTGWKAALVRTLFARTTAELSRRRTETGPPTGRSFKLAELEAAATPRFDRSIVRAHVRGMPVEYPDSFDVAEMLRHLELATAPSESGTVVIAAAPVGRFTTVTVVARDRPGLLAAVAGVFALRNVSVLHARLFTRDDGLALDTFRVEDAFGAPLEPERWGAIGRDVEAALAGELDLDARLERKARAYQPTGPATRVRVEVDRRASIADTVIEVHCDDRLGRLYRIAHALHDLGLDVRLAKIDTRGDEVVDTFYVRTLAGAPVRDAGHIEEIGAAVAAVLES